MWIDGPGNLDDVINDWFLRVAAPVALARWQWMHAQKHSARNKTVDGIEASDWRQACLEWMDRRIK